MTTTVKIMAHCSDTIEVQIAVEDEGVQVQNITIQDGEETEVYVYDNRVVLVEEVEK